MLEEMKEFFTARVDEYDAHMLLEVEGCKEAYQQIARLVPSACRRLLDLGCGTGLELDEIYRTRPDVEVTGIDMTQAMLDRLREKHPARSLNLICASYFDVDFGEDRYDCAVSVQTMHHFSHEAKSGLYKRVFSALRRGGVYIECDYMVEEQEEEDFYYAENARMRKEMKIPEGAFYHYDTPCTIRNQTRLLEDAGFYSVENVFRIENTTILVASKS